MEKKLCYSWPTTVLERYTPSSKLNLLAGKLQSTRKVWKIILSACKTQDIEIFEKTVFLFKAFWHHQKSVFSFVLHISSLKVFCLEDYFVSFRGKVGFFLFSFQSDFLKTFVYRKRKRITWQPLQLKRVAKIAIN